MRKSQQSPQPCTVEELLRRVKEVSPSDLSFELWVPGNLTMNGQPIDRRAALAIVFERVRQISEDFVPVGFLGIPGGELHRFEKWSDAEPSNRGHWFGLSVENGTVLRCVECGDSFDLRGASADHHLAVCPVCGVECIYLDWKGRIIQIVLKNASPVFAQAIRIMQDRFDELEYVEFIVAVEELADALYKTGN